MPAALADARPARRRVRERHAGVGLRGQALPQHRAQRGGRPAAGRVEHGAGALRRDAPGLLRHRRPHRRHGPRRHLGLAVLPVARRRVLRRRRSRAATDQELGLACVRAWNDWHHEVWAGTYPERIIPLQLPWLPDVEVAAAEVRGATPRAASRRSASPRSRPTSGCRRSSPTTGTRSSPPARRPAPSCACTPGRRSWAPLPSPDPPFELCPPCSRSTRCWPPPNGCGRACRCGSRELRRGAVRGRDRLGADADRPARLRAEPLGVGQPSACLAVRPARRARCCGGTSGSAPSTTRPRSQVRHRIGVDHIMVESDYPHADSIVARHPGAPGRPLRRPARRRRRASSPTGTPPASSATRCRRWAGPCREGPT